MPPAPAPPFLTRLDAYNLSQAENILFLESLWFLFMSFLMFVQPFPPEPKLLIGMGITLLAGVGLGCWSIWYQLTGEHNVYKKFITLCEEQRLLQQGEELAASYAQINRLRRIYKEDTSLSETMVARMLKDLDLEEELLRETQVALHLKQAPLLQRAFEASRHAFPWENFTETAKQPAVST